MGKMYEFGQAVTLWRAAPEVDGVAPVMECFPCSADQAPRGTVIVLPGGGYRIHTPQEARPVAGWLNSIGISAYVVYYRIAPNRFPAPLADVQRAIKLIRANNLDLSSKNQRIAVIGFSAGGNLAAAAASMSDRHAYTFTDDIDTLSCQVDAAIMAYAVLQLAPPATPHRGTMMNLLGECPTAEEKRNACPTLAISNKTPPCFIWHTAADTLVNVNESIVYAQQLAEKGIEFELHIYSEGGHGLSTYTPGYCHVCQQWMNSLAQWLHNRGF